MKKNIQFLLLTLLVICLGLFTTDSYMTRNAYDGGTDPLRHTLVAYDGGTEPLAPILIAYDPALPPSSSSVKA